MAKIRRRGDGWVTDCFNSGARLRRTFETRREAEEFKREFELRRSGDISNSIRRITIEDSVKEYLTQFTSGKAKETQPKEKKWLGEMVGFFKSLDLLYVHEIELIHLQKLQKHILARGVKGGTVNREFVTYKHYINQARLWKHTASDPCFGLKPLTHTIQKKKLWKNEDIWRVHAELFSQWHKDAVFLCARTGARPRELCRLEWKDVDLDMKVIRLTTFKGSGDGKIRELPITDEIIEFLRGLRARKTNRFARYVLTNRNGNQCHRSHLSNAVTYTARKLGIKGCVLYGMKHTLASELRSQGTDIETIRQILGHTNLNTTQRYLQNLPQHDVVRNALKQVHEKMGKSVS